jgi:hypothetical protein
VRRSLLLAAFAACLVFGSASPATAGQTGNVKATQHGGTLTLKADNDNATGFTLTSIPSPGADPMTGIVVVEPVAGTTVNGAASSVSFSDVTQVNVKLGALGPNSVSLDQVELEKGVSIKGGNGAEVVSVDESAIGGNVSVSGGAGTLDFQCHNLSHFGGDLVLKGGSDPDFVVINDCLVDRNLRIGLGDGNMQTIDIEAATILNLAVKTGRDNDSVELNHSTVTTNYKGDLGSGQNAFDLTVSHVGGKLSYVGKTGVDFVSLEQSSVAGDLNASLGNGANQFLFDDSQIEHNLTVSAGSGDDEVDFENTVEILGKITFKLDGGLNTVPAL